MTKTTNRLADLSVAELAVLWSPWKPELVEPVKLSRLMKMGLLCRVGGDYFVTQLGKDVRAGKHAG